MRLAVGVEHEYGSCIPPEKGNGILCMKKEMGFCAVPSILHAEIPPEKGNGILCSSIPPAC